MFAIWQIIFLTYHTHRKQEWGSKGHWTYHLPEGRISCIYSIPNRCLSYLFLKPSNVEVFQAPHAVFSSPCKFLMILGILSSSITTSHIPLLNSTCLSAPSKAVHSSGSICLQFFMRVSSQDVWVPLPSCVSLLTNIPHPPISLSPSVWHPFAPKIISSSFHFHSQEFSP